MMESLHIQKTTLLFYAIKGASQLIDTAGIKSKMKLALVI